MSPVERPTAPASIASRSHAAHRRDFVAARLAFRIAHRGEAERAVAGEHRDIEAGRISSSALEVPGIVVPRRDTFAIGVKRAKITACAAGYGAAPIPQLPTTSVVTPCITLKSISGR